MANINIVFAFIFSNITQSLVDFPQLKCSPLTYYIFIRSFYSNRILHFSHIPLPYQKRKWLNQYYHHIITIDIIRASFQLLITEYSHFSNCNEFKIFAYVLVDISKLMPLFFLKCIWYLILIIYLLTNKCLRQIDFILFNRVCVTKTSSIYNHISYSMHGKWQNFLQTQIAKTFAILFSTLSSQRYAWFHSNVTNVLIYRISIANKFRIGDTLKIEINCAKLNICTKTKMISLWNRQYLTLSFYHTFSIYFL